MSIHDPPLADVRWCNQKCSPGVELATIAQQFPVISRLLSEGVEDHVFDPSTFDLTLDRVLKLINVLAEERAKGETLRSKFVKLSRALFTISKRHVIRREAKARRAMDAKQKVARLLMEGPVKRTRRVRRRGAVSGKHLRYKPLLA